MRNNINCRIWVNNERVKYAGTDKPSWLTLEQARKLVNYDNNESIIQYDDKNNKLWEIF